MDERFWIVMSLLGLVAIASLYLGWRLGIAAEARHWTEEAYNEFKKTYFDAFVKNFEERVNAKSDELAAEKITMYIESLPEEQQAWFLDMKREEKNDDAQTST